MKRCPKCNRLYKDAMQRFCLTDGNPLILAFDPEATLLSKTQVPPLSKIPIHRNLIVFTSTFIFLCVVAVLASSLLHQSPTRPAQTCILYNDDPKEQSVNARTGCDRKLCDSKVDTVVGAYSNGTLVQRKDTAGIKGDRFTWVQVVILSGGQTVWVADNKVSCRN